MKITFIRKIENGLAKKVRLVFAKLRSIQAKSKPKETLKSNNASVSSTFKKLKSEVSQIFVSKAKIRALELFMEVLKKTEKMKRETMELFKQITKTNTKKDISKIMYLLSKKFKRKIDDKFLSEQIKLLILKNNIHNPSILDLLKQTEIQVSSEEYGQSENIENTESLLQIFAAIELFYPTEMYVMKIKQTYNRAFFRLLGSWIENKRKIEQNDKIKVFFEMFEKQTNKRLKCGFSSLTDFRKSKRQQEFIKKLIFEKLNFFSIFKLKNTFSKLKAVHFFSRLEDFFARSKQKQIHFSFIELMRFSAFKIQQHNEIVSRMPFDKNFAEHSLIKNIEQDFSPKSSLDSFGNIERNLKIVRSRNKTESKNAGSQFKEHAEVLNFREGVGKLESLVLDQKKKTLASIFKASQLMNKIDAVLNKFVESQKKKIVFCFSKISKNAQFFRQKILKKKTKNAFQKLDNIAEKKRIQFSTISFEKIREQAVHFEVLEIEDLTHSLEPISIHLQVKRDSTEIKENNSKNTQQILGENSIHRNSVSNLSEFVFVRKSDYVDEETQIQRYAKMHKPQVSRFNHRADGKEVFDLRRHTMGRLSGILNGEKTFKSSVISDRGESDEFEDRGANEEHQNNWNEKKSIHGLRAKYSKYKN